MKGLLIYSGGLDSTTLLYEYKDSIKLAVTFDYGSKHNAREIACAVENCKKLGIKHLVIPLGFIGQYFKSDLLLSGGDIPEGHYADENMKSTVVPFRNGIMLAVAAGLAVRCFWPTTAETTPSIPTAVRSSSTRLPQPSRPGPMRAFKSFPLIATSPNGTLRCGARPSAWIIPLPIPVTRAGRSTVASAAPA